MRAGGRENRILFAAAFAAVFAALGVGAPRASSRSGLQQRMMAVHHNVQHDLSLMDALQYPATGSPEPVGKFLGATSQPTTLTQGAAYPSHVNPKFLYGISRGGTTVRCVGPTGESYSVADLGDLMSRITGATLVTRNVPADPSWKPGAHDLADHYVVTGVVNQATPGLAGMSTGFALLNPKTMAPFPIGTASMFVTPTPGWTFDDVCFAAWPGPDGDYATVYDNEYRYVLAYLTGLSQVGGLLSLSLNPYETATGTEPPSPWNPVTSERGPPYANAYPIIGSNAKTGAAPLVAYGGARICCRSYHLRPAIPGCSAPAGASYVLAGWVTQFAANPTIWRPRLGCFSLGTSNPIAEVMTYPATASDDPLFTHPFSLPGYFTGSVFKGLAIVGDWAFATTGDGQNGDEFGDVIQVVYIPEMIDGAGDLDDGWRGYVSPSSGSQGFVGYHPNLQGQPSTLYAGSGGSPGILYGTTRSVFQDYGVFGGVLGAGPMTPIDLRTEEEKFLGLAPRRAPQPFVGFHTSDSPADAFDGSGDGGGNGEGCSGSAAGRADSNARLFAFLGILFLMARLLRECRA